MKRFIIDDCIFELFPTLKIGVVICRGISNSYKDKFNYEQLLVNSEKECLKLLEGTKDIKENKYISIWREAMKKFPAKKGMRSSVESFARRILNGNHINCINPVVDIYNSISIKYLLPFGGEDLDCIIDNMTLTIAKGKEYFIPLGEEDNKPPETGEVIYMDGEGAVVRGWLWREADRTKITENMTNALLYTELIDESREAVQRLAINELVGHIENNFGGKCEVFYLTKSNKEAIIEQIKELK